MRLVSRRFSAFSSEFLTFKSSASEDFAAISPSSWPMYSALALADVYSGIKLELPFRRDRNARAETLFLN